MPDTIHFRQDWALLLAIGLISCGLPSREIIFEQRLSNGGTLRVTRIAGGPVGAEFAFKLSYQAEGSDTVKLVTVWEHPPGESKSDDYEQPQCLVIMPLATIPTESSRRNATSPLTVGEHVLLMAAR